MIGIITFAFKLPDHLGPASGRDMIFPFNDRRMEGRDSGLAYLASVGIRIKTIVTDHHLTLVRIRKVTLAINSR